MVRDGVDVGNEKARIQDKEGMTKLGLGIGEGDDEGLSDDAGVHCKEGMEKLGLGIRGDHEGLSDMGEVAMVVRWTGATRSWA